VVIGLFADMVILRTDLGGNPGGREFSGAFRAATLEAYTHADFPFEELVRILERMSAVSVRASLSRVMVIWQNAGIVPVTAGRRHLSPSST
jgi:non-ribosomal peptide synthetase component F